MPIPLRQVYEQSLFLLLYKNSCSTVLPCFPDFVQALSWLHQQDQRPHSLRRVRRTNDQREEVHGQVLLHQVGRRGEIKKYLFYDKTRKTCLKRSEAGLLQNINCLPRELAYRYFLSQCWVLFLIPFYIFKNAHLNVQRSLYLQCFPTS